MDLRELIRNPLIFYPVVLVCLVVSGVVIFCAIYEMWGALRDFFKK
jgi:hypothetical protein